MRKSQKSILLFIALFIGISYGGIAQKLTYAVAERSISVDADTADWAGVPTNRVNSAGHLWVGQGMVKEYWKGPDDLSFTWRSCRHENTLYFLYVVTDNILSKFNQPNSWLNDCVEICIDPHYLKGIRKDTVDGKIRLHGYEMHFLPSQPPHSFLHDDKSLYFTAYNQDKDFVYDWNGKIAVKYIPGGYIMELALSVPGVKMVKGMKLGLETAVGDDDGNGRKSLLTWTGLQTDFWISMDKYGVLSLQ